MKRTRLDALGFATSFWATVSMVTAPAIAAPGGFDAPPPGVQGGSFLADFWRDVWSVGFRPGHSVMLLQGDWTIAVVEDDQVEMDGDATLDDFTVAEGVLVERDRIPFHEDLHVSNPAEDVTLVATTVDSVVYGEILSDAGVFPFAGMLKSSHLAFETPEGVEQHVIQILVPLLNHYTHRPYPGPGDPLGHSYDPCTKHFDRPAFSCIRAYRACMDCCLDDLESDVWLFCGGTTGGACLFTTGLGCMALCLGTGPGWLACAALCIAVFGGAGCTLGVASCGGIQLDDFFDCREDCGILGEIGGCLPILSERAVP